MGGDMKKPQPVGLGFETGGARRNRTADLVNAIHTLSQLSYGPVPLKRRLCLDTCV